MTAGGRRATDSCGLSREKVVSPLQRPLLPGTGVEGGARAQRPGRVWAPTAVVHSGPTELCLAHQNLEGIFSHCGLLSVDAFLTAVKSAGMCGKVEAGGGVQLPQTVALLRKVVKLSKYL